MKTTKNTETAFEIAADVIEGHPLSTVTIEKIQAIINAAHTDGHFEDGHTLMIAYSGAFTHYATEPDVPRVSYVAVVMNGPSADACVQILPTTTAEQVMSEIEAYAETTAQMVAESRA